MITRERLGILAMVFIVATLGGGVAGYVISAATVEAAAAPRVIAARKFVLLDQAGKTRAQLDITTRGVAQLAIMDGTGVLRAGLGVAADGAPGLGWPLMALPALGYMTTRARRAWKSPTSRNRHG